MDIKGDVENVIFQAIDEVNQLLPREKQIPKALDTVLLGPSARIDSLSLVNLIVEVEQRIQDQFNSTLNLADQRSVAERQAPLETIGGLVEYISYIVEEERGG